MNGVLGFETDHFIIFPQGPHGELGSSVLISRIL